MYVSYISSLNVFRTASTFYLQAMGSGGPVNSCDLTFIRRTHQILLTRHPTNAPIHRPFKCPVRSGRCLELWPHKLSRHYIIGLRQIHASATLTNYVRMHLMNSKFLASLYLRNLVFVFFFSKQLTAF
jgi:hypothetical protein